MLFVGLGQQTTIFNINHIKPFYYVLSHIAGYPNFTLHYEEKKKDLGEGDSSMSRREGKRKIKKSIEIEKHRGRRRREGRCYKGIEGDMLGTKW